MNKIQIDTTNPTKIKKISHAMFQIVGNFDDGSSLKTLNYEIDVRNLSLPANTELKLHLASRTDEEVITLGDPTLKYTQQKCTLEIQNPSSFRVYVSELETSKIIAKSTWLRLRSNNQSIEGLLPIDNTQDIGSLLWKLQLEGESEPLLLVNSSPELQVKSTIENNLQIQSFLLPELIKQIMIYLCENLESNQEWVQNWLVWLNSIGCEPLEDITERSPEEVMEWAEDIASSFVSQSNITKAYKEYLEGVVAHD